MAKIKTAYFCQNCGSSFSKWQGQCHVCKSWNTIVEEVISKPEAVAWSAEQTKAFASVPLLVEEIDTQQDQRLNTLNQEL
ncbi:hypothetical protein V6O07_03500, partial [Arthrospira platensis SPKY2]